MATCGRCGTNNSDDMRFCTNCGGSLPGTSLSGESAPNSSSVETLSFRADPQTTPPNWPSIPDAYKSSSPPIMEAKKSKTGLIIGIVAGVLLIGVIAVGAGVGIYFYSGSKTDGADEKNNNGVHTTSTVGDSDAKPKEDKKPSPSPTPASSQTFEPPTVPTKDASFTVYGNGDWQLSSIAVLPLEEYTTSVDGIVDLANAKAGVRSRGINDAQYKGRRLFQEWPTGALLMRTRYADGRFSNTVAVSAGGASGSWKNLPDERGMLEFRVNDNQQKDNGGQFTIRVKLTKVPKA